MSFSGMSGCCNLFDRTPRETLGRRVELDEHIADFAHSALATGQTGNVDGTGTVCRHSISNGAGAADRLQGWEIVHIVTNIGHMREGQTQACT